MSRAPETEAPLPNFYARFEATARRVPERVAVEVQRRDGLDRFTYAGLERLALAYVGVLARRGVGPGERCAILAGNDAHWCAAYLGVLACGAVAVPLDTNYSAAQVATLLRDCGARVLFAAGAFEAAAREAAGSLAAPCEVLALHEAVAPEIAAASGDAASDVPRHTWRSEAPAVILYTSGTTSDPKGVVLSHGNILAEGEGVFSLVRVTEQDAVLGVLPLFHALAQLANLLLPFWIGCRVVFLEQLNTTELLRALKERDCSAFCCVPQFFYLIHQRIAQQVAASGLVTRWLFATLLAGNGWLRDHAGVNLGRVLFRRAHRALGLRMWLLVTGGSRFDARVARDLRRLGFDILQAYGLTECSGAATVTRPGTWSIDDVGPPLPGVEIKTLPRVDEDGRPAADGEILVRGPIVMQGYWNRPDANAVTLADGWLHTGDLGYLDDRGRLHITGRQKEVIVLSSGKNIYPEEIEAHYVQSPVIKEMCVVGLARDAEPAAERLHAVVVPDADVLHQRRIVNARELVRFELENYSVALPHHKRVLGFDLWTEDLPRTTTRKLKRFEIERRLRRHRADEGAHTAAAGPSAEDAAWAAEAPVEAVLRVVREAAPDAPLRRDANLELDLGLDSMERVELLTLLQQRLGTTLDEEVAQRIVTLADLASAFASARRAEAGAAGGDAWEQVLGAAPPADEYLAELDHPKPVTAFVMWSALRVVAGLARLLLGFRVKGREHLPAAGPYLLCPNHESYLDGFLLGCALPFRTLRGIFFVGASEYFTTPLMRRLARAWNIVPVDPDANLVRAMQVGAYGLRRGGILVLFPEGERSIDGDVKAFRKGATILATRLKVPVVPAAFEGAFDVWPRSRPFNWRALLPWRGTRTTLRFGPPVPPETFAAPGTPPDDTRAAARLREIVVGLRARGV